MRPRGVLGALLQAILPMRAITADEPAEVPIETRVPFTTEGRLDGDGDEGPVHLGPVVLQNLPAESEAREASRPGDIIRPQPLLVVSHRGPGRAGYRAGSGA